MSNKRARSNSGTSVPRRAKRPIDKKLANIEKASLVNAQQSTDILSAMAYPGTITGLRWDISFVRNAGATGAGEFKWAIILLPQSSTAGTLATGDGASLYDPEQNVLVYGAGCSWSVGDPAMRFNGETSTMRKLKTGDKVQFICFGSVTNAHLVSGTVMCFVKS